MGGSEQRRVRPSVIALGAASGALLFLSDYPLHLWPLQALALVPLLAGLAATGGSKREAALAGLALGLCYLVPLAIALEFPPLMAAGLAGYLCLLWVATALGAAHALRRWSAPWGALGAAAVATLVEWVDFTVVPVWGTAQCFARVWSAWPPALRLTQLAGVLGLVFVLVAGQAALGALLARRGERRAHALLLAAVLLVAAAVTLAARPAERGPAITVGAVGWTADSLRDVGRGSAPGDVFRALYAPLVRSAAAAGATLIVAPEVSFFVDPSQKAALFDGLAELARQRRVVLAVGYFDRARDENRVAVFRPEGQLPAEYVKTHLIPAVERYRAGRGELVLFEHRGARVGIMICQDDNFTDLARAYGRAGAQLLLVPTNDWRQVKDYHLENSVFRTVENGYAVVRAASNGISAIVDAAGRRLAAADHFATGPAAITAAVRPGAGGTLYSAAGDWIAGLSALLLIGAALLHRRRGGAVGATRRGFVA